VSLLFKNELSAFYVSPRRFFALLMGVGLALSESRDALKSKLFFLLVPACFLLLILVFHPFSYGASLLASMAAYTVIWKRSWFSVILSLRPLTFLGDISYSLYLVHWPIVVFLNEQGMSTVNFEGGLLYYSISFIIAVILFFFVENRFNTQANLKLSLRRLMLWVQGITGGGRRHCFSIAKRL